MTWLSLFPDSASCSPDGRLCLAGRRVADLAGEHGTPLYLYDALTVQNQVGALRAALADAYPAASEIAYAAKAYFSLGFARRLAALGLGADVVSLGEWQVARRAGFPPGRLHLHGNNKTPAELVAALEDGARAIVVDSLDELDLLEDLAARMGRPARIWLRLAPGVAVDTHAYRQTAHPASKFGLPISDGQAAEAVRRARRSPVLRLAGLHVHIGSQISQTGPYRAAIHALYDFARQVDYVPAEFSPGGGWHARYHPDDPPVPLADWVRAIGEAVQAECRAAGWPLPRLILEPGRWIAARAGVAVYTVGACKRSGDGTRWIAVDGGMADNPRPALYGARYAAVAVDRAGDPPAHTTNLAGRFCESGDFLILGASLPDLKRGDLLAVPAAGAYQLSMASNYNLAGRPAALWISPGQVEVLQAREDAAQAAWWAHPAL